MAKYLGLDVGEKRVGLALADSEARVAVPFAVFIRQNGFWDKIKTLYVHEGIERIIVGWPVGLDGQNSVQTEAVEDFIQTLQRRLPEAIVERVDERMSSKATNLAQDNDAQAAALILNNYLERQP